MSEQILAALSNSDVPMQTKEVAVLLGVKAAKLHTAMAHLKQAGKVKAAGTKPAKYSLAGTKTGFSIPLDTIPSVTKLSKKKAPRKVKTLSIQLRPDPLLNARDRRLLEMARDLIVDVLGG